MGQVGKGAAEGLAGEDQEEREVDCMSYGRPS